MFRSQFYVSTGSWIILHNLTNTLFSSAVKLISSFGSSEVDRVLIWNEPRAAFKTAPVQQNVQTDTMLKWKLIINCFFFLHPIGPPGRQTYSPDDRQSTSEKTSAPSRKPCDLRARVCVLACYRPSPMTAKTSAVVSGWQGNLVMWNRWGRHKRNSGVSWLWPLWAPRLRNTVGKSRRLSDAHLRSLKQWASDGPTESQTREGKAQNPSD